MTQSSTTSALLEKYSVGGTESDIKTNTEFDLILLLGRKGWDYMYSKPSRKTAPYTPGDAKVWLFHTLTAKGGINRKYLDTLIASEDLFERGLKAIYHFQVTKYYVALQTVPDGELNNVLPFQPTSYYALLLQKLGYGPTKAKRKNPDRNTFVDFADDEPGAFVLLLTQTQICFFSEYFYNGITFY